MSIYLLLFCLSFSPFTSLHIINIVYGIVKRDDEEKINQQSKKESTLHENKIIKNVGIGDIDHGVNSPCNCTALPDAIAIEIFLFIYKLVSPIC